MELKCRVDVPEQRVYVAEGITSEIPEMTWTTTVTSEISPPTVN
jgi:hypothetical protein